MYLQVWGWLRRCRGGMVVRVREGVKRGRVEGRCGGICG